MNDLLDPETLSRYRQTYVDDGVVKVPGLLSQKWINALLATIDQVHADEEAFRVGHPTFQVGRAKGRMTIRWLWRDVEIIRKFFIESETHKVVAPIIGAKALQYWYDLTFIHEPGHDGAGTPWHHDIAAFPVKGEQIPSLWIALQDVDDGMSPLQCIKGSHKKKAMYRPPTSDNQLPAGYEELPDYDALLNDGQVEALTWTFKAGDALIIHPYTVHGAQPNKSHNRRVSFTTRWMGDDVVWAPDEFSMKVPGVEPSEIIDGQRPSGRYFPFVT